MIHLDASSVHFPIV